MDSASLRETIRTMDAHYRQNGPGEIFGCDLFKQAFYPIRYARIARFIRKRLQPKTGQVLDIGCATGGLLAALQQQAPQKQYLGSDISGVAVSYAQQSLPHAHFFQGGFPDLPLAPEQLEGVICLEVMGHLTDPQRQAAILEISRLLQPDGWLCFSVKINYRGNGLDEERARALLAAHFEIVDHLYYHNTLLQRFHRPTQRLQNRAKALRLRMETLAAQLRGTQPMPATLSPQRQRMNRLFATPLGRPLFGVLLWLTKGWHRGLFWWLCWLPLGRGITWLESLLPLSHEGIVLFAHKKTVAAPPA
ncbi:Methyltransferase type 11 [Magnetococcus marinus MC-1]|uniref:Methyltransferase type 11 n=1 Tax=Magnetococcus marinus (strain ATCC BAA-1437 / JCM 17883 / MC-1) TaxID=156889 RepID=A0LC31_MAGMM|nr:class I SAM-dependent methyltransferase [Magnetococcus marinus]ABK45524.1 Methyltransferase type 11 [Magnetococcus marinus MC-1]